MIILRWKMNKKKRNWFFIFLKFALGVFLIIYIALENGYYERQVSQKTALTEKEIRQFENDSFSVLF